MKIVCIGDSLTFGYGVNKKDRWVELSKSILKHKNIEIVNKGVNGDTTSGILSRFYDDVIDENPSHVFIMCGSNDFLMGLSVDYVFKNLLLMIKDAEENSIIPIIGIQPSIISELANIHWEPYLNYSFMNSCILAYKKMVVEYCTCNHIAFVDFHSQFLNIIDHNENTFYIDGLHLNAKENKLMAENFTHTIL